MKKAISLFVAIILLFHLVESVLAIESVPVNIVPVPEPGFQYKAGDVLITKSTSANGFTGHVGIITSRGNVVHMPGKGIAGSKREIISIGEWFSRYPSTQIYRYYDSDKAAKAGAYAYDVFGIGRLKDITYRITPNLYDQTYSYCSELVWQSYYYGAGVIGKPCSAGFTWQPATSIITPYDFTCMHGFNLMGSINW
ncbi:hypothetical protein LG52_2432 [Geobacillus kaustophilus]|uniref:Uncharacterized protein n=1 Tax=Geobacillus kaustophilus TaxID=1462 RepID=A0A0D8BQI9_GEOKU|nr:YiiX/YebB-like N1pC/P60 family cysteine hydrolase [Geobacillus kaustophilus]KJE26416.1 hypothetical protein LG52_2432 [Geobacillus kaustophilus]